jgi:membrane associated rhomboid family serine protease
MSNDTGVTFDGALPRIFRALVAHPLAGIVLVLAWALSLGDWLGLDRAWLVLDGRPLWAQLPQLLSSTLLHGDLIHLLFNSYWFLPFTGWMEARLGRLRTVGLLLFWASAAAAAQFAVSDGGIGLSGVCYAQAAFFAVARRSGRARDVPVDAATERLFVVWFFLCIAATMADIWPVANVAHAGGAVFGALCGWAWRPDSRAIGRLAVIAAAAGGVALAATTFRPLLNDSAYYGEYLVYEASVAREQGDTVAAERSLRRAIRQNERNAQAWTVLGYLLADQDRIAEMELCCERAFELDPEDPAVRSFVGWRRECAAVEAGRAQDFVAAARLFGESVELDEERATAWTGLGISREALGDKAGARVAYARAVRLDASELTAKDRLEALRD